MTELTLRDKYDKMVDKARERGYTVTMYSGDYSEATLTHPIYNGALVIYPAHGQFEFIYMTRRAGLQLSSGKMSPFDSDEHFNKNVREFHEAAHVLYQGFERD